jgi:hypothetical protein
MTRSQLAAFLKSHRALGDVADVHGVAAGALELVLSVPGPSPCPTQMLSLNALAVPAGTTPASNCSHQALDVARRLGMNVTLKYEGPARRMSPPGQIDERLRPRSYRATPVATNQRPNFIST